MGVAMYQCPKLNHVSNKYQRITKLVDFELYIYGNWDLILNTHGME